MNNKTLVAFFSASGVTKQVAEQLSKVIGADLFEIKPAIPYTAEDLNWMDKQSRSSVEMGDPSSRPEMKEQLEHMEDYDVVFVGFPIWWYVAPTIIHTFFESYDFTNKTIVLFATSGGSGFGDTVNKLRKSVTPSANIIEGKVLNGNPSMKVLTEWGNGFEL